MSDELKWKTGLLSSGLPLESEAARLLVSKGFRVDSDLKYARTDSAEVEEFSVDLHARASTPFANPGEPTGSLDLVLECRHRHPALSWLFLPEPNPPAGPSIAFERTVRVVDQFSPYRVDAGATATFEAELPLCCKGLEIDLATGRVDDCELSRGLAQLRYALPRLMVEGVLFGFSDRSGENVPFLFCPVLLTTAPLLVANKELGIKEVEESSELRELAAEVPYLVMVSDCGPDFQAHCGREFRALEALERSDELLMVETKRAGHCQSQRELPVVTIESLIAGDHYWLRSLFSRFVVCHHSGFPALVDKIRQAAESLMQSRAELR